MASRSRRSSERDDKLSSSDTDCHLTAPQWGHVAGMLKHYHASVLASVTQFTVVERADLQTATQNVRQGVRSRHWHGTARSREMAEVRRPFDGAGAANK
jgi:hypothetical protein